MKAFVNFDKPLVAAVHGSAIGGGTTMLTHCDFVYAGESAKFQLPFVNLGRGAGVWIELLDSSVGWTHPCQRVVSAGTAFRRDAGRRAWDRDPRRALTRTCWPRRPQTAQQLAAKPAGALRASKRLLKRSAREQLEQAMRVENEVFAELVRSADAKEALTAFIEKRRPNFTKSKGSARRDNGLMTSKLSTTGAVRVAFARMPTRWGVFQALGFEREIANGDRPDRNRARTGPGRSDGGCSARARPFAVPHRRGARVAAL